MIELSSKFLQDIQPKETNITPLIVIDGDIYISTNRGLFDSDIFWEDYSLSISNISESIDIENKKFKINNLSFSLTNFPINDNRFSNLISERALINKYVDVYYKTQSCSTLDECLLIYSGKIKRFRHDS